MHSLHTEIPGTLDIGGQIIEKNYVLWINIEFFGNQEVGAWIGLSASDIRGYKYLLLNCLTYAEDPKRVVEEAARVLKPDGALVAVTLASHGHEERVASYGHIRMGFAPTDLRAMFLAAGLAVDLCAVTSRERSSPHFEVISAHARKEAA